MDSLGSWGVLGAHAQKAGVGRQIAYFSQLFLKEWIAPFNGCYSAM